MPAFDWIYGLVLLGVLAALPPVRAFLAGLPRAQALLPAGFVGALLAGHLIDRPSATFPFVSWKMFSSPAPAALGPLEFYETYGASESDERVRLNPARLFPSLKNYRMTVGLTRQVDAALAGGRSDVAAGTRLSETLRAIGRRYNREHPEAPVRSVEVYRCQLDPRHEKSIRTTYRWQVWRVDVGGAP